MPELHFSTLIADLAHYDRWLPGSNSFGAIRQIAPVPIGLGTTYVDAGPAGTRRGEATEYEPPTRICFHQPMEVKRLFLSGTIDIHLRQTLEPMEQRTRVNRDFSIEVRGMLKLGRAHR